MFNFLFCKTLQTNWSPLHLVLSESKRELVNMVLERVLI